MTFEHARAPIATAVAVVVVGALVALFWVYAWARHNTSVADAEVERLIVAAALCLAAIGGAMVLLALVGAGGEALAEVVRAAGAGAFVAVAASAAATMLIAMAIALATDPGEFGRPLFRIAYVGALALSAVAGATAASVAGCGRTWHRTLPALLALLLTGLAWAYLAVGSSELNQCVVDDEIPLATDHVCSGY